MRHVQRDTVRILIRLARPRILLGPKQGILHGNGTNGHEQPRFIPLVYMLLRMGQNTP